MAVQSTKLNKSLDEIVLDNKKTRRNPGRLPGRARKGVISPVGGIKKTIRAPRAGTSRVIAKPASAKAMGGPGGSKIIVSNLPKDVDEGQIKEYFTAAVGPIKKVELSYGPNSVSRGIASVIFAQPNKGKVAYDKLHGIQIDGRPMKVEVVLTGDAVPPPKSLVERVTQVKAQPKSAAPKKAATKPANKLRHGRSSRPAPKTAEELDHEMADYFADNTTNGNTNATTSGDVAMDVEDI